MAKTQFNMVWEMTTKNGGVLIQCNLFARGFFDFKLDKPQGARYTQADPSNERHFSSDYHIFSFLECWAEKNYAEAHIKLSGRPVAYTDGTVHWITYKRVPLTWGSPAWQTLDRSR